MSRPPALRSFASHKLAVRAMTAPQRWPVRWSLRAASWHIFKITVCGFETCRISTRHAKLPTYAVRKSEYGRLQGRQRRYIKGQKYTLLSRKENLSLEGKKALKMLLAANKRAQHGLCSQRELRPAVEL